MPQLPTGTLTFLFTDIEGSTRHVRTLGPLWDVALEQHHRLMRAILASHGGTEVASEGDSFFVAFPTAIGALQAAAAAQRALAAEAWPGGSDIKVRMGLHTGTASIVAGSYTGLDVHRASRIMSAAHGAQVLVSDATRGLVGSDLPPGLTVRDLGEHRLKDLAGLERLHELVVEGSPATFAAPRTLDLAPGNLPIQLTTFLGRQRELAEIGALLEHARLVTLTGPGGTGKTRVALQAAARAAERFPDGVWFVALASIDEAGLVPPAIAAALGIPERAGKAPVERIVDRIGHGRTLIVLDNFEQVADAAPVLPQLLAGAPELAILVTSRAILRVYGEQEYPVPPLALPDGRQLPHPDHLARYEAVALFVERAKAARPGFSLSERNAAAVAEICLRLDGLPLAIELAAARIRHLPPEAILERLGRRLELLAVGPRDLPERQRTLRGTIEWSHDLLDDSERRLFAALSVFSGGAGLDAIGRVCADVLEGMLEIELLDRLASLVEKSLLREDEGPAGAARFRMLETIREFALERSVASGGHNERQRRHAEWFAELVERQLERLMSPAQREVLDGLEQEHPNFRAAIAWAVENGRADLALRVASRLWRMWQMRGHLAEGRERVREALAMPSANEHPELRAAALEAAGGLAYWSGDVPATRDWYEQALQARRDLGEPRAIAEALYNLSFAFSYATQVDEDMDVRAARRLGDEARSLFRQLGDASGEARAEWMLTSVDAVSGDFEAMASRASRVVQTFRDLDDRFYLAWGYWSLAFARLGLNRPREAMEPVRDAFEIFSASDDVSGCGVMLEMAAMIASGMGDLNRAARLSGAVASAEASTGLDANVFTRAVLGFDREQLRTGDTAEAWEEGARMEREEAVAYARGYLTEPSVRSEGDAAGKG